MRRILLLMLSAVLVGSVTSAANAATPGEPTWEFSTEVTCDDVEIAWTAADVDGWTLEIDYPPGFWHLFDVPFTQPSGNARFIEPWLFGFYSVRVYDHTGAFVDGSEETVDLARPAGCGPPHVTVAGGPAAVSDGVVAGLGPLSRTVERISGPDRYATAAALSEAHFPHFSGEGPPVFIATGENWPDALAGGPSAAYYGGPILLVHQDSIPAVTAAELRRLNPSWIDVWGGFAAISWQVADDLQAYTNGPVYRTYGANRYATAARISATTFSPGVDAVYIATGRSFPDALGGGPAAAARGGPILLVGSTIPGPTATELRRLDPASIYVLGGPVAVSTSVEQALRSYTTGPVIRLAGPDRYATAAAVSADTFGAEQASMVYVATGANFPDGLTAGPIAGMGRSPILLVRRDSIPQPTKGELQRLGG